MDRLSGGMGRLGGSASADVYGVIGGLPREVESGEAEQKEIKGCNCEYPMLVWQPCGARALYRGT